MVKIRATILLTNMKPIISDHPYPDRIEEMEKQRIDQLLVARGLAPDISMAQRLVMAGQVRADGQVVHQASSQVPVTSVLQVEQKPPYVSRGGEKLSAALTTFPIQVSGRVCADVGASTGGFTDCLLQHGAAQIYAIDVGQGILAWKLRQDPRVIILENTNARYLTQLPQPVDLVTVDVSFISLKTLLPVFKTWARLPTPRDCAALPCQPTSMDVITLIKPQFEARRKEAQRYRGVIRDPAIHQRVLREVLEFAQGQGYTVQGLLNSPISGSKGNREFLAWLAYPGSSTLDIDDLIAAVLSRP